MTVVNNTVPSSGGTGGGEGVGMFMGILVLVVFLFLLFYYGLPMLRNASSGPQISVPDKIDVDVGTNQ